MTSTFHRITGDRDSNKRRPATPGALVRLARALGPAVLVALGGLFVGLGVLRATNVFRLIPEDGPLIWVSSRCGFAEAAARAALHATPDDPVFLIPLDQGNETMQDACRSTLAALAHQGYGYLRYFPEQWLCRRLVDDATASVGPESRTPAFYAGGQRICDGLCDDAFERLGHPELRRFVTIMNRGQLPALDAEPNRDAGELLHTPSS